MDSLISYASQSTITDPGRMAYLFNGLPTDVPSLRRIASGLVVHYRAEDLKAIGIPDERVEEINTRYAEKMLQRIIEIDDRPLMEERPKVKRRSGAAAISPSSFSPCCGIREFQRGAALGSPAISPLGGMSITRWRRSGTVKSTVGA